MCVFYRIFELDEGVSVEAVAGKIEKAFSHWHLDPFRLRGQAYDGAGNMLGKHKGCAAILQKIPKGCVFSLLLPCFKFGNCEFL